MLVNNTPVETYQCGHRKVYVKREDLCSPSPGPAFSKIRGVYAHIKDQKATTIGVLDTYHSKAGWAVAYVCRELGKKCVNYYPVYKRDWLGLNASKHTLRAQQQIAKRMGAKLQPLQAGRSAILYHQAKKALSDYRKTAYMMPNALKLSESVDETAAEVCRTNMSKVGTIVVSISSGTIAAGVVKGLSLLEKPITPKIIFHLGYNRSEGAARRYIEKMAGTSLEPFRPVFINEGYDYKDQAQAGSSAPFPCNPYYDLKAWSWLEVNMSIMHKSEILFWNVGE